MGPTGIVASAALAALTACAGDGGDATTAEPVFEDYFTHTELVELEEPGDSVLGRLTSPSPSLTGDTLLVLDPMTHQVRLHARRSGELLALRGSGRPGDGPGEFRVPFHGEWDHEGRIWITEQSNLRLTILSPDLSVDTVIPLDASVGRSPSRLRSSQENMLWRSRSRAEDLALEIRGGDGERRGAFHPVHPNAHSPYWIQYGGTRFDASDSLVVAVFSMEYPLTLYFYGPGGERRREELGSPPPSWRQATLPERGEFAVGSGNDPMAWRMSFTRIHDVGIIGRDCILVVHEVPDPTSELGMRPRYLADLYRLSTSTKLLEDTQLPGRFLTSSGDQVLFQTAAPPSPWTISIWKSNGCS